jgi:hypothetical protein
MSLVFKSLEHIERVLNLFETVLFFCCGYSVKVLLTSFIFIRHRKHTYLNLWDFFWRLVVSKALKLPYNFILKAEDLVEFILQK